MERGETLTVAAEYRSPTGGADTNFETTWFLKEADFVGVVSGKEYDKFKATGLTPDKSTLVNAPIVKEFPYTLECKLVREINLGSHTMFIGEIVGMVADSEVLNPKQLPDIEKVRPMLWGSFGSTAYYTIGSKLGDSFSVGNVLKQK